MSDEEVTYEVKVNNFEALVESFKCVGRREDKETMLVLSIITGTVGFALPTIFAMTKMLVTKKAHESVAWQKIFKQIGQETIES